MWIRFTTCVANVQSLVPLEVKLRLPGLTPLPQITLLVSPVWSKAPREAETLSLDRAFQELEITSPELRAKARPVCVRSILGDHRYEESIWLESRVY